MLFPVAVLSQYIFGPILFLLSFFIIGIILLQRGRGGGLTGALGGLGGQSAFGVKAGDIFTRITAISVLLWIFFAAFACWWFRPPKLDFDADISATSSGSGMGGSGLTTRELNEIAPPVVPAADPVAPLGQPNVPAAEATSIPADTTAEPKVEGNAVPAPTDNAKEPASPAEQPAAATTTPAPATEPPAAPAETKPE